MTYEQDKANYQREWQSKLQSLNVGLMSLCRGMYQSGSSETAISLWCGLDEWLIKALIGKPPHEWWIDKGILKEYRVTS